MDRDSIEHCIYHFRPFQDPLAYRNACLQSHPWSKAFLYTVASLVGAGVFVSPLLFEVGLTDMEYMEYVNTTAHVNNVTGAAENFTITEVTRATEI